MLGSRCTSTYHRSQQTTVKTEEGAQHPDRDAQFRYVNEQAKQQLAAGQPVISVDTKKRALLTDPWVP
jgi:hypothetical protein